MKKETKNFARPKSIKEGINQMLELYPDFATEISNVQIDESGSGTFEYKGTHIVVLYGLNMYEIVVVNYGPDAQLDASEKGGKLNAIACDVSYLKQAVEALVDDNSRKYSSGKSFSKDSTYEDFMKIYNLDISPDEKFDQLSQIFVPSSGKAWTKAGEFIRAVCRLGYRWYNDGDLFFRGYGLETAGPSAAWLVYYTGNHWPRISESLNDYADEGSCYYLPNGDALKGSPGISYDKFLNEFLCKEVLEYLKETPSLFEDKDFDDSRDFESDWLDGLKVYGYYYHIPTKRFKDAAEKAGLGFSESEFKSKFLAYFEEDEYLKPGEYGNEAFENFPFPEGIGIFDIGYKDGTDIWIGGMSEENVDYWNSHINEIVEDFVEFCSNRS